MADLNTAISRLEQVTARLLRFEASLGGAAPAAAAAPASASAVAASNANVSSAGASPAAASSAGSPEVVAYEKLLAEQLQPFMASAAAIGGEVLEASKLVEKAFKEQRTVLLVASKAKQPDTAQLQSVLQPVAEPMMAAGALADNRRSPCFQQLKVVAEGLQGLSWLAYTGPSCGMHPPPQHIAESWNSAEFFANKLLKEFRGVDENQVAWVRGLKELFTSLQAFVRVNCPTGLRWNSSGLTSIAAALAAAAAMPGSGAAAAPATAGGGKAAPVAPPPPPAGYMQQEMQQRSGGGSGSSSSAAGKPAAGGAGGMQDVLKALQQGSGVTSGLRKVTDDMKAKNRADRSGHVTTSATTPTVSGGGAAKATPTGPPRLELEQERKWVVENQVGQQELIVTVTDPKHSVYIYNCSGSVVQVKGKCNAISIDKCKKTGVLFEQVIASCELVNCAGVQVQCTGTVPTMSIDKCDGVQAYIPAALAGNPNFQVVTAKSSEINLLVVSANPEAEDVAEHPVPEQFISTFQNGKLVTTAASHGGG